MSSPQETYRYGQLYDRAGDWLFVGKAGHWLAAHKTTAEMVGPCANLADLLVAVEGHVDNQRRDRRRRGQPHGV